MTHEAICSWCRRKYAEDKIEAHEQWHTNRGDTKSMGMPPPPPHTTDDYTGHDEGIVGRNDTDTAQVEGEELDIPE